MIRAFIAIEIPVFPGIKEFISDLEGSPVRIKTVEAGNLHITLRFLGDIGEEKADELGDALKRLENEESFSFYVKGAGAFPSVKNPKVVWAGIDDSGRLSEIQRKVEDICESLGLGRDKRSFSPHLTLGRVKERNPKGLRPIIERYRDRDFGTVEVMEIKLKKSVLTPRGPIYSDLALVNLRHP